MALVGGGGAGNTAGSNPSGTSGSLVYLGNNQYAGWSGTQIATNGANASLFDFTTPDQAIMIQFTYMVDDADLGDGNTIGFNLNINGEDIAKVVDNSGEARTLGTLLVPLKVALPGQSRIIIQGTSNDASNITVSGVITGVGV